ncbi:hypothetical protein ACLHDG_08225 [Sulfurovum sp. CS9]|uniref:hypothetical protein n=1 Tax=Sulfurovum sp. CS9 TaxID=3391146 RepID=UPI0039ECC070
MADRIPLLVHARRFHNLLRNNIESDDGRGEEVLIEERPVFEHYACGMYLSACLAYLDNKYGQSSWKNNNNSTDDFDTFLLSLSEKQQRNFTRLAISESGIDALVCIRNAFIHNNNDLKKNTDKKSLLKVSSVKIPGITLNDGVFILTSNNTEDFMQYVRLSLVAVAIYYGDG